MKMFRCCVTNWLCSAASGLLVLLMLSSAALASDVRYLWQSRDQFVALERQDLPQGGTATLNDHPAEIVPDRLTSILASITVREAGSSKPEQLFTDQSLEMLVPHLAQGFQQAAPGEDVTFAIIGLHKSLFGFAKSPKVTTGRVFFKNGRLNVILGLVRNDVNEREDRRLSPYTPGSRQKASQGEWTLLPQPGQNGFSLTRKDWVTFSDTWQPSVAQTPVAEQKTPAMQTAPVQPEKPVADIRSPADRLTTLNELKNKGLISEEEYRVKRLEILNGL